MPTSKHNGGFDEPLVVQMARETLAMHERILQLEMENTMLKQFKDDYFKLLNSTTHHNDTMMRRVFEVAVGGNEACPAGH